MAGRISSNPPSWYKAYIVSNSSSIVAHQLPLPTIPNSVSESVVANTNDQQIVGRSAPIVSYLSTGARTVSFTFAVADEYMPTYNGYKYTIHTYINALKSLVYPRYTKSNIISPQCVLHLGNITLKGIVTNVSVTWNGPVSNFIYGGNFTRADINLQFKEVTGTVKGAIDIKSGN